MFHIACQFVYIVKRISDGHWYIFVLFSHVDWDCGVRFHPAAIITAAPIHFLVHLKRCICGSGGCSIIEHPPFACYLIIISTGRTPDNIKMLRLVLRWTSHKQIRPNRQCSSRSSCRQFQGYSRPCHNRQQVGFGSQCSRFHRSGRYILRCW